MPILLLEPFNPGDLDPGQMYPHAKITRIGIDLNAKRIDLMWTYGTEVSGVWRVGNAAREKGIVLVENEYQEIVQSEVSGCDNGLIYEGVKRAFYEYLLEHDLVEGTIFE